MSNPKQKKQAQAAPEVSGQREQERPALPTQIAVRAYPVSGQGTTLANLTLDINGCFAVRGARLMQGKNGPFVSYPSCKVGEEYKEHFFPTTREMRDMVTDIAVSAYEQAMGQMAERMREAQSQSAPTAPTSPTMAI